MPLNEKQLLKIGSAAGLGEKAVSRLIASQRISIPVESSDSAQSEKVLDIGLRIDNAALTELLLKGTGTEILCELLSDVLREYMSLCPVIVGWVGRGDYNPDKIPDSVNKARLLHACRTAGRLRAKVLRSIR